MSVMTGCDGGGVVRCGYLKKLKTSRRKFFVLRAETSESSARLEYYDSERKYQSGQPPKRSIPLKNCFNINKRSDTKHKHVIALYTKDDNFCVVLDNEEDVDSWLKELLKLQHGGEEIVDGETPKPTFEHVWHVTVLNRGLGTSATGLTGNYRLCLTARTLSLIKRDSERPTIELNLTNIRSCGSLRDFFFLEIGRSSALGSGELWMQTEDNNIAQNVHSTVFHAMSANRSKEELLGPRSRIRSSSATESSKPKGLTRKVSNMPPKVPMNFPPDLSQTTTDTQVPAGGSSQHPIVSGVASFYQHLIQRGASKAAERRHSISAGSVTQPGTISHQRTQSLPLANPAPNSDQNTSHPLRAAKRSNQSSKCVAAGRERCDSMPSRARSTSEGTHPAMHVLNTLRSHFNHYRPASLYGHDNSHSPPSGSPVSPPSVYSTDSGSSFSLADEPDVCTELDPPIGRYGHSLTPDEVIAEEDTESSSPYPNTYIPMVFHSSDDGYVDMSPKGRHHNNSPTTSLSSVTSGTPSTDMKFSDYPLEKVASYFTSEEDNARPTRAYSVGSKPECYKKYTDMLGQNENLRVRALSVGSKTKKMPGRVLPPHSYHPHQGTKSSSAPLLSNTRGQGSHSSIGPMGDLMEMDFSRSGSLNNSSGYMDMTPGPKNNHGYVEMKPGRKPDPSPYVDMSQGTSPARPLYISSESGSCGVGSQDYMDMDGGKNSSSNNNTNSHNNNNTDYLTMTFNKRVPSNYQLSPAKASPLTSYFDHHLGSPKTEPPTPEGYVEMSLGRSHQRQSSLDSAQIHTVSEDYANMTLGGKKKDKKKKDKTRSQPIAIQNPSSNAQKGGTSSPRYALLGRKLSTGTPPMHLPLTETTPYSSLPRPRRRDSKDSSSSSVTTPSNSSTIFPLSLNSPCSPIKPFSQQKKTESDYTPMDFDNKSDYVNYNPKPLPSDDYAVMKPGLNPAARVVPMPANHSSFRPIDETNDKFEEGREPPYEVLRGRPSSAVSRPGSATSELCSSGSTIVGSRPESVNSDRVRPPSVSSADVQLHYASLDLDDGNRSPRTVKSGGGGGEAATGAEVTLTYAAIDFGKSEGLKHNSLSTNAKVKH